MSPASNKTKVVVVGGSWAGVSICTSLETLLPTAEITLLEERSSSYNAVSSIRVVVEPTFPQAWGMMVEYDYLVVCDGDEVAGTWEDGSFGCGGCGKGCGRIVEAVRKATSVTIVGGASLVLNSPAKSQLTITRQTSPALRKTLLNNLQTLKVNVLLTNASSTPPSFPPMRDTISLSIQSRQRGINTSDVQFDWKETVDERGFVRTERTGQVVGHSNIFALGDIANIG
ncbi:hypothetical protein BC829DRAFT_449456 [Chytridium lagenaria]|nr:hypothetical protein BC829DRAFT_449456 [Chytridium lagenaria]